MYKEKIAAGIAKLNDFFGDESWIERITTKESYDASLDDSYMWAVGHLRATKIIHFDLNQKNTTQCVLAHVFGTYDIGLRALHINNIEAIDYGFNLPFRDDLDYTERNDSWRILTLEWILELNRIQQGMENWHWGDPGLGDKSDEDENEENEENEENPPPTKE